MKITLGEFAADSQGIHLDKGILTARRAADARACDIMGVRRQALSDEILTAGPDKTRIIVIYVMAEEPGADTVVRQRQSPAFQEGLILGEYLLSLRVRAGQAGQHSAGPYIFRIAGFHDREAISEADIICAFHHQYPEGGDAPVQWRLHDETLRSGPVRARGRYHVFLRGVREEPSTENRDRAGIVRKQRGFIGNEAMQRTGTEYGMYEAQNLTANQHYDDDKHHFGKNE